MYTSEQLQYERLRRVDWRLTQKAFLTLDECKMAAAIRPLREIEALKWLVENINQVTASCSGENHEA